DTVNNNLTLTILGVSVDGKQLTFAGDVLTNENRGSGDTTLQHTLTILGVTDTQLTFTGDVLNDEDTSATITGKGPAITTTTATNPTTTEPLQDGRDFSVIRIDKDTIAFGAAFNGTQVNGAGPFPLAPGVSGVDPTQDVIVFGQPHYFHTGDAVWYAD